MAASFCTTATAFRCRGAYYGEFSRILQINRGVHEPLEEYLFQETLPLLSDAPVMLELGAYWAHYSMWLRRALPRSTAVMVEPDPDNLAVGRANVELNGTSGEFINDAVGAGGFEVDSFMRARGYTRIDLLHADIQGHELQMLDGCRQSLAVRAIHRLFVSTHSQELHGAVVDRLQHHGYRIDVSSDFDHHTTAFDGLVLASIPTLPARFADFRPLGRNDLAGAPPSEVLSGLMARLRRPAP